MKDYFVVSLLCLVLVPVARLVSGEGEPPPRRPALVCCTADEILPGRMEAAVQHDTLGLMSASPIRGKAFLRSLLIPGWGQKHNQAKTSALNFFVAELALWGGFVAFQVRGHWLEDDYLLFGATHSGFDPQGKDSRFFADAGSHQSIEDYNQAQLRSRNVAALYDPATHYWKWDSAENRQRYYNLRRRSERAFANSTLLIAGILANHVVSGIHAAYLARQRQQPQRQGTLPSPRFYVAASPAEIRLLAGVNF